MKRPLSAILSIFLILGSTVSGVYATDSEQSVSEPSETAGQVVTATELPSDSPLISAAEADSDPISEFVSRFYIQFLNRTADPSGLQNWTEQLVSGSATGTDIAAGFVNSPEFQGAGVSDETYVRILYRAFFDREADSPGLSMWTEALASGLSRQYVLQGFCNSDEFTNLCARFGIARGTLTLTAAADNNPGVAQFVIRFYRQCLNREPDTAGLNDWVSRLVNNQSKGADVAFGFVFSQEFLNRNVTDEDFVNILYAAFFNRSADAAGWDNWLSQLKAGETRRAVLAGFVNSEEFKTLAQKYGIDSGTLSDGKTPAAAPAPYDGLAAYCRQFLGVPYVYGGSTPRAFDCSGFVCYVFKNKYGIILPHYSASISKLGTRVDASSMQPGDVICYDYKRDGTVDHVAIYVGDGRMIHASTVRNAIVDDPLDMGGATTIRRFL